MVRVLPERVLRAAQVMQARWKTLLRQVEQEVKPALRVEDELAVYSRLSPVCAGLAHPLVEACASPLVRFWRLCVEVVRRWARV